MNRIPVVTSLRDGGEAEYDLLICALGYEARARFIAETRRIEARRKLAVGFNSQQVLRFAENKTWFASADFEVQIVDDQEVRACLEHACHVAIRDERSLRVCCDISSMSRYRIATLVDILRSFDRVPAISANFLYAVANFNTAPAPLFANTHVGPVLSSFAGWTAEPELPASALVGLGYEPDKALGAVEHLQASEIWTFEPISMIAEYTDALRLANRTLLEFVSEKHRLQYNVDRPYTLFVALQALASSCLRSTNPVILPFGPKLFTLASLLVASIHPDIAVWRVSAGMHEPPIDRQAHGFITGLSAEFAPVE